MAKLKFLVIFSVIIFSSLVASAPLQTSPNNFSEEINLLDLDNTQISFTITNLNNFSVFDINFINTTTVSIFTVNGVESNNFTLLPNESKEVVADLNFFEDFNDTLKIGGFTEEINTSTNGTELIRNESLDTEISLNVNVILPEGIGLRALMTIYANTLGSYCSTFPSDSICVNLFKDIQSATTNETEALITQEFLDRLINFMNNQEDFSQFLRDSSVDLSGKLDEVLTSQQNETTQRSQLREDIDSLKEVSLTTTIVLLGTFLLFIITIIIGASKHKKKLSSNKKLRGN